MKNIEKLPRPGCGAPRAGASAKKWLKRMVRRARRRIEQRHPEDVPTHLTKGWYW